MTLTVRPLCTDDYPQWRPLWDGYTHFYECYLDESKLYWVTRMNNPARKLYDHYGEADDYVRYRISL